MLAILAELNEIARRTGRLAEDEVTIIYNAVWKVFVISLLICGVAFALNAKFGQEEPSGWFLLIFIVAASYVWWKPTHILYVAGGGAAWGLVKKIASDGTLVAEVERALRAYLALYKWWLVGVVTFLFITSNINFHGHSEGMLFLLGAAAVIGIFNWMWPDVFVGARGRKIVYGFAVVVIFVAIARVVLGPVVTQVGDKAVSWTQEQLQSVVDGKPSPSRTGFVPTPCPNASAKEVRTCRLSESWSNEIQFADGSLDNGKHLCSSAGVDVDRKDRDGVTFWRFRAKGDDIIVSYRLYDVCPLSIS